MLWSCYTWLFSFVLLEILGYKLGPDYCTNPWDFYICSSPTHSVFSYHTALGIKRIEKGAGSLLGAGTFSSCFEDDGQWLLCKPSGFQMHSWAVLLSDAWCLCLCSTNRAAHARYLQKTCKHRCTSGFTVPSCLTLCMSSMFWRWHFFMSFKLDCWWPYSSDCKVLFNASLSLADAVAWFELNMFLVQTIYIYFYSAQMTLDVGEMFCQLRPTFEWPLQDVFCTSAHIIKDNSAVVSLNVVII